MWRGVTVGNKLSRVRHVTALACTSRRNSCVQSQLRTNSSLSFLQHNQFHSLPICVRDHVSACRGVDGCSRCKRFGCGQDQIARRYFSSDDKSSEEKKDTKVTSIEERTTEPSIPGAQKGGKKLAIIYTCTVCNTRAAKQFTERAYNHGVVIVQCPGCDNRHLIADNLGFFPDEDEGGGWNIEKAMEKLGEHVNVVNNDSVLELSVEDVYGEEAIQNAIDVARSSSGRSSSGTTDEKS